MLAAFWGSVTGATPSSGSESLYLPPAGPGGFALFFQPRCLPSPNARSPTSTSPSPGVHANARSNAPAQGAPLWPDWWDTKPQ